MKFHEINGDGAKNSKDFCKDEKKIEVFSFLQCFCPCVAKKAKKYEKLN